MTERLLQLVETTTGRVLCERDVTGLHSREVAIIAAGIRATANPATCTLRDSTADQKESK